MNEPAGEAFSPSRTEAPAAPPVRHQLILASLFPLIVFSLLTILLITSALQNVILSLVTQRNNALAVVAASSLSARLQGDVTLIQQALPAVSGEAPATLAQRLAQVQPAIGGDLALVDSSGQVIASAPSAGLDSARMRSLVAGLRAGQPGEPRFSARKSASGLGEDVFITVPVSLGSGGAGWAVAVFSSGQFDWFQNLGMQGHPGAQLFLVDQAGTPIASPQGQPSGRLPFAANSFNPSLAQKTPVSLLTEIAPSGDQAIVSIAPLSVGGWYFILAESWVSILAPAYSYEWAMAGLLALGILFSMVLLSMSIGRVIRPLAALAQRADQLGPGSLFYPLVSQGPLELRVLTEAFNRMVIRLAEQQAAMRHYAEKALLSQEEERQRISHELHDETVQDLVGLMQRVDLCQTEMDQDPALARRRLAELRKLAGRALGDLRRISNALRPSILQDLGLVSAIQSLSDELASDLPGTRVDCAILGQERRLPAEIELSAFRVAQEAMTNIRKHAAGAREVWVSLSISEDDVRLSVRDDGPGFQVPGLDAFVRSGHLGLAGMAERAHLIGGRLEVVSSPGEGTTVQLSMDCAPAALRED